MRETGTELRVKSRRGRPRLPDSTRLLRGDTHNHKRGIIQQEASITYPAEILVPPAHLDDFAKEEWGRVAKLLADKGLFTEKDRTAFASYCQSYSAWRKAEAELKKDGLTAVTEKGTPIVNPAWRVCRDAQAAMLQLAKEFGMTPMSAAQFKASGGKKKGEDDDLMAEVMGN